MSSTQKLVLYTINNYTDEYGERAWPSVQKISAESGLSKRTVFRTLVSLANLGFLSVTPQVVEGTKILRSNSYSISYEGLEKHRDSDIRSLPPSDTVSLPPCQKRHEVVTHDHYPSDTVALHDQIKDQIKDVL